MPGVISSVIDTNTRPVEVYAVDLVAGQTVLFEPNVEVSGAYFELYVPDTTILWDRADRQFYQSVSTRSWTFTPATSGTYRLRIRAQSTGQPYTLTMRNGVTHPLSGAPDDLPGLSTAVPGVISSVIDTNTRPVEVYAVDLVAGQTVLFEPNVEVSGAYFELYVPDTTSAWDRADRQFYQSVSTRSWTFTPATSGTYRLRIRAQSTGQPYTLTMRIV